MSYDKKIFAQFSMMHRITNNSWTIQGLWAGNAGQAESGVSCPLLFDGQYRKATVRSQETYGVGDSNRMNIRLNASNVGLEILHDQLQGNVAGDVDSVESTVAFSENDLMALLRQRTGTGRGIEHAILGVYTS